VPTAAVTSNCAVIEWSISCHFNHIKQKPTTNIGIQGRETVPDTSTLFGLSRRSLLTGLLATPTLAATVEPGAAQPDGPRWTPQQAQAVLKDAKGTKLVLLGTAAGPVPGRSREMTSHVMLSNGAAYVLDCGMGVTNQYARTGIPFHALKSIFITHHHADHNIEYGPLLIVGWIQGLPLDVRTFGPPPLKQMTEDFMRAYKQTVDFWAEDFQMKPLTSVNVQEISTAGAVTQDDNVKVSAILGLSLRLQGPLDCIFRRHCTA
jgi:hypothetical protein